MNFGHFLASKIGVSFWPAYAPLVYMVLAVYRLSSTSIYEIFIQVHPIWGQKMEKLLKNWPPIFISNFSIFYILELFAFKSWWHTPTWPLTNILRGQKWLKNDKILIFVHFLVIFWLFDEISTIWSGSWNLYIFKICHFWPQNVQKWLFFMKNS